MEQIKNITDYNSYLIESKTVISILDYIKQVNNMFYKIDVSFVEDLLELVIKDECCIHHNLLQKYGIVTLNKGTTDIRRLINQYEFIETVDFRLRNVAVSKSGGCTHKTEYYFHPRSFKLCLMRSLKTKKYAKYYLLLEDCVKFYNDYQNSMKDKYIVKYKTKIDNQKYIIKDKNDKIDDLQKSVEELLSSNKELLFRTKLMESQNTELLTNNKELLTKAVKADKRSKRLEQKLDDTHDKLNDTYT